MQTWQIELLEGEASALDSLDGFIHEYALWFLVGAICLLSALLAWVLSGGLRRKFKRLPACVHPVVVVHTSHPPPPSEPPFDPFPPIRDCDYELERLRDPDYYED